MGQTNGTKERVSAGPRSTKGSALTIGPIGFIFCLANAAVLTAATARFFKGAQSYGDLVAGSLVWNNADKSFDFRLFHVFVASFGLIFLLLLGLCRRLRGDPAMKRTLERALALALVPGAFWLGARVATNSFGTIPFESLFAAAAVVMLLFALSRQRLALGASAIDSLLDSGLLILLFSFFSALGVATALVRVAHIGWSIGLTVKLVSAVCSSALIATLFIVLRTTTRDRLEERISRLLFGSQIFLPFLLAIVLPPALLVNGARVLPRVSVPLVVSLAILAGFGWTALLRNWKRGSKPRLVAWALVGIAVFLAVDQSSFPTFSGDDFHLGEHLLPWQQLRDFGKLPFVDFVPVHPLMDLFAGAINSALFDGTLANYENSRVILFAVAAGLTFVTVARFANPAVALYLAFAANLWDRLLLVPALLAVLCYPPLFQKRARWLWCCGFLCLLALAYNPAVGTAMSLACSPFAIFQTGRLFGEDRRGLKRFFAGIVVIAGICLAIPPIRAVSLGFVEFLIANGRTVMVAHGLEWRAHTTQMPGLYGALASPLVWETLRFSWLIVLVAAGCIGVGQLRDGRNARPHTLLVNGLCCLFLFGLAPWTLNRIDPFMPSRTGEVSYLACLYLLPLLLYAIDKWRWGCVPVFAMMLGFFQQGMAGFGNSGSKPHVALTLKWLLEKPAAAVTVPAEAIPRSGTALDLPALGEIYATKKRFESLERLNAALQTLLRPGETYLDLTNRQASYFYLGLPSATAYGAPWLAANTRLQKQLLEQIQRQPPPVVWIGPAQLHDTGTPALRTFKLYRYLTSNYVPVAMNAHTFLVEPGRASAWAGTPAEQMELLRAAFEMPALGRLPTAWGGSFENLADDFVSVQQLTTANNDVPVADGSATVLGMPAARSGRDADFVKFDFASNLSAKSNMEIAIRWTSELGDGSARLTAANGINLLPMGAYPLWLQSRQISKIDIEPVAPPPKLKYLVREVELLRLKD